MIVRERIEFERGRGIKSSAGIGMEGNPLKVENVGVEVMIHPGEDRRRKRIPRVKSIGDANIESNLRKMEAGIPDGQMPRFLHQYKFLLPDDKGGYYWADLEEVVGNFIEVRGKVYDFRRLDPNMEVTSWHDDPINEDIIRKKHSKQ